MRQIWLALTMLLYPASGNARIASEPEWQSAQVLQSAAQLLETYAYHAIDSEAAAARVRYAARTLPGIDPARFETCMARRNNSAWRPSPLVEAVVHAANCVDLAGRRGQERYLAFRAIADAISASADKGTAILLTSQLSPYLQETAQDGAFSDRTQSGFAPAGIGISLGNAPTGKAVIRTEANSPARRAGIEPDDVITAIDGTPTAAITLAQAVAALRGAAGSKVTLAVSRGGGEPRNVALQRRPFAELTLSLEARRLGDALVVDLRELGGGEADRLRTVWASLGGGAKSLIIDLRGNPGGTLDQAVALADSLLTQGEIGTVTARKSADVQTFRADAAEIAPAVPVVVLTDAKTAAGAEILAAALHDNHRALLLGARTYGRGTIQTLFMADREVAVKVTTGEFLRPGGVPFDAVGIVPDCQVDPAAPNLIDLAIRLAREGQGACPVSHG